MNERIAPVHWRKLVCVFEKVGFTFRKRAGRGGSHWVGERPGTLRPVIIPEYAAVGRDIIHSNLRTAGVDRERYLELLAQC